MILIVILWLMVIWVMHLFYFLLTTVGSGGAFKLRSVRVSQGDMVYGVYGGDGPRLLLGVFPRTTKTGLSSCNFGNFIWILWFF